MKIFVLGGSFAQARRYARENDLDLADIVIVLGSRYLEGVQIEGDDKLLLVGTWAKRADVRTVFDAFKRKASRGYAHSIIDTIDAARFAGRV